MESIKLKFEDIFKYISENKICNPVFLKMVNNYISNGIDLRQEDDLFLKYIMQIGDFEALKVLLNHNIIKPDENNNYIIKMASHKGYLNIINYLVMEYKVDITLENNICFLYACQSGNKDIIRYILETKKIKSNFNNNEGLKLAVINGHLEVASMFIEEYKCDEQSVNKEIIQKALQNGFTTMVEYILARQAGRKTVFKPLETDIQVTSIRQEENNINLKEEILNKKENIHPEDFKEANSHESIKLNILKEEKKEKRNFFFNLVDKFF